MDLKNLLGDKYKEDLTVKDIEALLADKNLVDSDSLGKTVSKDVFDKTASELSALKKRLKEAEEKSMTIEEKTKMEMEKAVNLQKEYAKELSKLKAKEIFVNAGLKNQDYESLLDIITNEDEEITKNNAKSIINIINAQKEIVEKNIKAELLKSTPTPPAGDLTKAKKDYSKEIEEARKAGNLAAVAALIRQEQMEKGEIK